MSKNQKMEEAMNHAKENAVNVETTEVKDVVETEEKVTVQLTPTQLDKLMTIVEPEEKVGLMKRIKNKIHKPKITLKGIGIGLGVAGAVVGGVVAAKKLAGNNDEEDFVDVNSTESLPDDEFTDEENDDYKTQETETIEVEEF